MSVQTVARQADLPSVNLIPPEIHESRDFKRLQAALAAVVALSFVAVGAFWYMGRSSVQDARDSLASAQAEQTKAQRALHSLQYINTSAADANAASAVLAQVQSTDVHWSAALDDLSVNVPTGVWYTQLSIAETVNPAAYTAFADVPDAIGTIQFKGAGRLGHDDVANWLDVMTGISYAADPTFSTVKEAEPSDPIGSPPQVSFTSTLTVTKKAIATCDDNSTGAC